MGHIGTAAAGLDADVLVIGAGPAGAMAAALLVRDGFRVRVVEKQTFPRFVIGESMLPSSMGLLEEAGLLTAVHERQFIRKNGAVFKRGDETCDFSFSTQFSQGWDHAYQVPRAEFDQALADAAAAQGVEIEYEQTVTAVDFDGGVASLTVASIDGSSRNLRAKFVLDCSGYGRVLPRLLDLDAPSKFPPREATFAHVTGDRRPAGAEEGKIWVCMHSGGAWIWIIPFSDGRTSVGVVAEPGFFDRYPTEPAVRLRAIVAEEPNAAARLAGVAFAFEPRTIRGYACSVKALHGDCFALVGNATEFLDPIFSSGMALALESAKRASTVLARQLRGEAVDWQADYADHVMHGVNTFRVYVQAWYDGKLPAIFFAPDRDPLIMRQVCSLLAGYVWDKSNPYVMQPARAINGLSNLVKAYAAR